MTHDDPTHGAIVLYRQWATARLHEFLVKGFTVDDERLKNPKTDGVVRQLRTSLTRRRVA